MAGKTRADTDKIDAAEARIAVALQAVREAADQLDAHTREFYAAAGSDAKNGNLKQQSRADQNNKSEQYAETDKAAEHDRAAARAASAEYAEVEADNTASLKAGVGESLPTGFE